MKKQILIALAGLLLVSSQAAAAEQRASVRRIGLLSLAHPAMILPEVGTLQQRLHELGYVPGKTIEIEARYGEENLDRLPALAAEMVNLKVELILAHTSAAARAASRSTKKIPIVMIADGDPVMEGLVTSLARPGGNITGLTQDASGLMEKRFELLKQTFPGISRVAFLFEPTKPPARSVEDAASVAKAMGIQLQWLEARGPSPLFDGLVRSAADRSEALVTAAQSLVAAHRREIVELAANHKVHAMFPSTIWSESGGLMSYGAVETDLFRRAAGYIDKIFHGRRPGEIPVEQATVFEHAINLETAGQMHVTFPQAVLVRADRIFR
jgi:putative ABC transport system substrate-binding protein